MSDHEFEDEQEIYATLVEINQEPTELYKILKFEHIVSDGGEAKQVISEGYVYLNGEVETRKRKKVYAGDLVYFNEQYFQIALKGTAADYETLEMQSELAPESLHDSHAHPVDLQANGQTEKQKPKKARKPISF